MNLMHKKQTLIDRMKGLFRGKGLLTFNTKETVIELNNMKIEAFPSHHLDAMRGLSSVSFILLDEADFFPPGQQADARDVYERYIAKSNPYVVMVSTPNAPDGLFDRIEKSQKISVFIKGYFWIIPTALVRYTLLKKLKKLSSHLRSYTI
jgi:hypothetical protein